MREIEFRGKRLDNGEWVYGSLRVIHDGSCHIGTKAKRTVTRHIDGKPFYMIHGEEHEVDPKTVGQYTGKVVKTGKLFQDDIGKNIDGQFLVIWDEEKAAFAMHFYDYWQAVLYLEEMWGNTEVIGNIHDNPELLGIVSGK